MADLERYRYWVPADHHRDRPPEAPASEAASEGLAPDGAAKNPPAPWAKRSTVRGEARAKLIAALTKHHRYTEGSCPNTVPIGNNELAAAAEVAPSTASNFFNSKFEGYTKDRALCRDVNELTPCSAGSGYDGVPPVWAQA